jgi:transposase
VVDFRKKLNGLIVLMVEALDKDPGSGELFIFRNRERNKLRMVYFDGRLFWQLYYRLEKGCFKLPDAKSATLSLSPDEFQWLLSGIDFMNNKVNKPLKIKYYY